MIFVSQLNHSRFPCVAMGLFRFYHPLFLPMSPLFCLSIQMSENAQVQFQQPFHQVQIPQLWRKHGMYIPMRHTTPCPRQQLRC